MDFQSVQAGYRYERTSNACDVGSAKNGVLGKTECERLSSPWKKQLIVGEAETFNPVDFILIL